MRVCTADISSLASVVTMLKAFQPVIRESREGEREMVLMRWGLIPFFAKSLADVKGITTINARSRWSCQSLSIHPLSARIIRASMQKAGSLVAGASLNIKGPLVRIDGLFTRQPPDESMVKYFQGCPL